MRRDFIVMLHYDRAHAAWLHLTGWESPPEDRDTRAALGQIETQTDEVITARGEVAHTPFVLLAGSIASERDPHVVRKLWRLAPELADRLLTQIEHRGTDEAIEDALAEWDDTRRLLDDDAQSLDLDEYVGVDFEDLARRAYPPGA
jgi:hypothetical protein